ncbi:small acid-soluble spore protein H [Sporolactobacillus putidus]|uniref:Small, acid-soluble spore protein H n=1 Tax=Sporolactobacillus putidus TaxID=492735 RepID=A0A917W1Q1_9BACL|nr:small acid-soluble spore protein H [Sporolactobacillus putidus]GGL51795.1 small, acid-soluble spore protein H [Sporolactobacillus putidus]
MDTQRAQEIAKSPVMVNVTHNGIPIYIQHVDESTETARIYPLDNPGKEQEVSIGSLQEQR